MHYTSIQLPAVHLPAQISWENTKVKASNLSNVSLISDKILCNMFVCTKSRPTRQRKCCFCSFFFAATNNDSILQGSLLINEVGSNLVPSILLTHLWEIEIQEIKTLTNFYWLLKTMPAGTGCHLSTAKGNPRESKPYANQYALSMLL